MAAPAPPPTIESGPIALEDAERELARCRRELEGPGAAPVLRARLSNLVVFCDSEERAADVAAQLPAVVATHPARVLLLAALPGPGPGSLTTTVTVHAHRSASGRCVCTEQVTIRAAGGEVGRLPFAVRWLVQSDLPINLWWTAPAPPPAGGSLFFDLEEYAEQVVYDSRDWPEPVRGVLTTAAWIARAEAVAPDGRRRVVSDLSWRRLKYWRRLLAQGLDPAAAPGVLDGITELWMEHGPHAVVRAWELAAWLAARLGWRVHSGERHGDTELSWVFRAGTRDVGVHIRRDGKAPPSLRCVRIACGGPSAATVRTFVRTEEYRLSGSPGESGAAPRTITVPPQPVAELVGRQLCDRERDPIFLETMATAREMAQRVLAG